MNRMAHYIGNEPANGEFKHLDSIASQFNGGPAGNNNISVFGM